MRLRLSIVRTMAAWPLLAMVGPLPAAEAPTVVRGGVDLVPVDALVTDAEGRQVTDLTLADFVVYEDGRPQTVTNCRYIQVSVDDPLPAAASGGPPATPTPI